MSPLMSARGIAGDCQFRPEILGLAISRPGLEAGAEAFGFRVTIHGIRHAIAVEIQDQSTTSTAAPAPESISWQRWRWRQHICTKTFLTTVAHQRCK
jgi:hypothetical protein